MTPEETAKVSRTRRFVFSSDELGTILATTLVQRGAIVNQGVPLTVNLTWHMNPVDPNKNELIVEIDQ